MKHLSQPATLRLTLDASRIVGEWSQLTGTSAGKVASFIVVSFERLALGKVTGADVRNLLSAQAKLSAHREGMTKTERALLATVRSAKAPFLKP